jgi:lariat debranching enzyme
VRHDPELETTTTTSPSSSKSGPLPRADNPDEIAIDDDAAVEDSRVDAPTGTVMVSRVAESIAPPTPQNPDEITLDDEIETVEPPPPPPPPSSETRFLALDKCLPHRQFLEASPPSSPRSELTYFAR